MPGKDTLFKPLWVDSPDALNILDEKVQRGQLSVELGDKLAFLIDNGYVILPAAISEKLADRLAREINKVADDPEKYIARRQRKAYTHPTRDIYDDPTFRVIDFHVNSRRARTAIFADPIREVLRACFEDKINAFQCLTFNYGSQQAMHQDAAYVVVSEPLQFMASWIALEDVEAGSGELQYHVGSHKLDDFLFGDNSKAWNPSEHGNEIHKEFVKYLESLRERTDMPVQSFLPKKGDALIWASDLVHGGAKLERDHTRRSIVTHYCPQSVKPKFSTFSGHYHEAQFDRECCYSSRHYDLREAGRSKLLDKVLPARKICPEFMGKQAETSEATD